MTATTKDPSWRPIEPTMLDGEPCLVEATRVAAGQVDGRLRLVDDHDFFFEHEIDHLPGLYLLEAAHQLARLTTRGEARWASEAEIRFLRYAEKGAPLELQGRELADGRWQLRALQAGEAVVEGACRWTSELQPLPALRAPALLRGGRAIPSEPVRREWVHKRRRENVLLEWLGRDLHEERFLAGLAPALDHSFFRPRQARCWPELLVIEALRQLAEAISHRHYGVPLGDAFVLEEIRIEQARPAGLDAPLLLVAEPTEVRRRKGVLREASCRFLAYHGDEEVLRAEGRWRVVPARVYRRLRGEALEATRDQRGAA